METSIIIHGVYYQLTIMILTIINIDNKQFWKCFIIIVLIVYVQIVYD